MKLGTSTTQTLEINAKIMGTSPLVFEGSNTETDKLTLAVAGPTADNTLTLPDETGTLLSTASATSALTTVGNLAQLKVTGALTLDGNAVLGSDGADSIAVNAKITGGSPLIFDGPTAGGTKYTVSVPDASADRTVTLPDASGTFVLSSCSTIAALTTETTADLKSKVNAIIACLTLS